MWCTGFEPHWSSRNIDITECVTVEEGVGQTGSPVHYQKRCTRVLESDFSCNTLCNIS